MGSKSVSDFSLLLPLPKYPTKSLFPLQGEGKGPRSQDRNHFKERDPRKGGGIQDRTPTGSEGEGGKFMAAPSPTVRYDSPVWPKY